MEIKYNTNSYLILGIYSVIYITLIFFVDFVFTNYFTFNYPIYIHIPKPKKKTKNIIFTIFSSMDFTLYSILFFSTNHIKLRSIFILTSYYSDVEYFLSIRM